MARISLLNARLTVASGKWTIWRLRSRMEDENRERKSKSDGVRRDEKESEGGLGVSAGRYPEWQASTAQLAVSRYVRGAREKASKKRVLASIYVYRTFQKFSALLLNHKHQKSN